MEVLGGSTARLHAGREITRLDNISLLSSEKLSLIILLLWLMLMLMKLILTVVLR